MSSSVSVDATNLPIFGDMAMAMFLAKSNVLLLPLTVRPLLRLPISIWLVVDRVFSGRGYLAVPELPELLATLFVSIRGFPFMVDLFENLSTTLEVELTNFGLLRNDSVFFLSEVATAMTAIVVDNLLCFVCRWIVSITLL